MGARATLHYTHLLGEKAVMNGGGCWQVCGVLGNGGGRVAVVVFLYLQLYCARQKGYVWPNRVGTPITAWLHSS